MIFKNLLQQVFIYVCCLLLEWNWSLFEKLTRVSNHGLEWTGVRSRNEYKISTLIYAALCGGNTVHLAVSSTFHCIRALEEHDTCTNWIAHNFVTFGDNVTVLFRLSTATAVAVVVVVVVVMHINLKLIQKDYL